MGLGMPARCPPVSEAGRATLLAVRLLFLPRGVSSQRWAVGQAGCVLPGPQGGHSESCSQGGARMRTVRSSSASPATQGAARQGPSTATRGGHKSLCRRPPLSRLHTRKELATQALPEVPHRA